MANYATYYPVANFGTPMMSFSLEMAIVPGLSEDTLVGQLAKALVYWQASRDPRAATAISWIQTEQARIQAPPGNTLHTVIPK